jgi:hypothetical protein
VITSVFSTADQFEFEFVGSFSESAASYYTLRFCWYRTLYLIARWASEMGWHPPRPGGRSATLTWLRCGLRLLATEHPDVFVERHTSSFGKGARHCAVYPGNSKTAVELTNFTLT